MAIFVREFNDGFSREYRLDDGTIITYELNDDFTVMQFFDYQHHNNEPIGEFNFKAIDETETRYKLTYMYVDFVDERYKRQGIGREALRYFKELKDVELYTSPNDGQTQDDGSHLTGQAPLFVAGMKREGIIDGDYPDLYEHDDEGFLDLK